MTSERIILCLNCGQQNRLKAEGRAGLARCGRCGEPLTPPRKRMRTHGWVALLLILTAGVTGYLVYDYEPQSKRPPPTRLSIEEVYRAAPDRRPEQPALSDRWWEDAPLEPSSAAEKSPTPVQSLSSSSSQEELTAFGAPPVVISTGVIRIRPGQEWIAPLEVRTSSGNDYFIKLFNVADEQEELAMYVEGGRTFTTNVPLGTYELRYAAGNVWYGERHRFGPDTAYYEADKQFTFYRQGSSVNGYTIELILQMDGNLRTRRIGPARF
jgi:hypothetical protein